MKALLYFQNLIFARGNGELQLTAVRALPKLGNNIPSSWNRCWL